MAELKSTKKAVENSRGEFRGNFDSLKKLLEGLLYSCELNKLEEDLREAFNVDETSFSKLNAVDTMTLLIKHICQSKKSSLLKQKDTNKDFYKYLLAFIDEATRGMRIFTVADFLDGIGKFMGFEVKSLEDSLESCNKKIKEAIEDNLEKKSSISNCMYLVMHAILSSNEMKNFVESKLVMANKTGLVNIVKGFIAFSRFPQHKDYKEVCILDGDDMLYLHENAFNCLRAVNFILQWMCQMIQVKAASTLHKSLIKPLLKSCIDEMAFVMLQHIGKHSWTSTETRVEAQNLLSFLCKLTYSKNIEILLSGTENMKATEKSEDMTIFSNGIAETLLNNICQKFFNSGWKRDPSLIHIIIHITTNMKYPNLKPHIKVIVPLLLEVIGDYRSENQVLGIECLRYLVENVTASDLNLYNHAALVYQALFKLLYGTEPPTLRVLLPCLQKILYVLEPFPERLEPFRSSKWDETLQKLITNLEYENSIDAREILVSNLACFIKSMGINSARYLLSILKATSFCLEMYDNKDGRIRRRGLDVLKTLVTTCWPIMWRYIGTIMKIILKVLVDISVKGAVVEEETKVIIKEKSKEILILLSECCGPESVLDFIDNVIEAEIGDSFDCVKEFLRDTKRDIELNGP